MKSYKKLLIAVVLIGLGLGVSGCKYEYDPDQIYTKHKNACEFSIRSIENNSPMMVVGEFLYNDGVCKCKENECSVGEVCYEKFDGDIICVDYMCNDGERKCVSGKGGAYIYGCSELNWKLEKICGGENESGRCNADKTDCEKCDGNVGGCEPTETIDCEPECIWVASNEFGHEYYEYKSCDKNGNPEKPKKCAFKCNDKIENGELGCVDCEKNECRDDKSLNVCDNGEFYVTTCPNGCSDGECKCNDGDVRCSGIDVQSCRDGKWITDASCSNGCSEGKCKVDCDDGDVKCDEDKYMICSGGNWDVSDECGESGCFYDENNKVMCKCTDQHLKCEGGELWKCFNGKWHARGGKDKWPGTNTNVMGMEMEENCVCKTNGEVDQLTTKEVFESICNFCFEDTSAQGYYYGNNNTNGSSECRDIASGKLLSCKADFSGCGECLNGTSECVGEVPKICENGVWRDLKNDDEARTCMSTMCANGAKRCDKGYIEVCNNNVWSAYEIPCLDGDTSCLADGTVDSYCYDGRYGWCSEDGYKEENCDNCDDNHRRCNMQSGCSSPTFNCKDDNTLVKTCGGKTEDEKCNSISLKNNKCYRVDGVRDYCGECLNRNTRCRDGKLQTCVEGKWGEGMPCSAFFSCVDNGDGKAECVGGSGNVCTDGEIKCFYKMDVDKIEAIYQKCVSGNWKDYNGNIEIPRDNCLICNDEGNNKIKDISPSDIICKDQVDLGIEKVSGVFSCDSGALKFNECFSNYGIDGVKFSTQCNSRTHTCIECLSNEVCNNSSNQPSACSSSKCSKSSAGTQGYSYSCIGAGRYSVKSDGAEWVLVEDCGMSGKMCNGGRCERCIKGQYLCTGDSEVSLKKCEDQKWVNASEEDSAKCLSCSDEMPAGGGQLCKVCNCSPDADIDDPTPDEPVES